MFSLLTIYDMTIDPFVSWLPVYDYCKLIVDITNDEIKMHRDFLKSEMKKNFY